jgi:hypothetical protein
MFYFDKKLVLIDSNLFGIYLQGFSRFTAVATSAAQNAASVLQASTTDIQAKVSVSRSFILLKISRTVREYCHDAAHIWRVESGILEF